LNPGREPVLPAVFFVHLVQFDFVHRIGFITLAALLLLSSCQTQPWYPPPDQKPSMGEAAAGSLRHFVFMSQPDADAYIVQGLRAKSEGTWRWAHENPALRFYLPEVGRVAFDMDFAFPEGNFQQTGPVTMTWAINGKVFDQVRYDKPGGQHYNHRVPPELLHPNAVNLVAVTPDKTVGRAESGERLGFVLTSAGFVE
jgi:hypothetical protein